MRKLFTKSVLLALALLAITGIAVSAARTFDQVITTGPGGGRPGIVSYSLVSSPFKVVTKTANYTITPTRDRTDPPGTTFIMNGSALTLTFPTPTAALTGYWYRVKNIHASLLTIGLPSQITAKIRAGNSSARDSYVLGGYANYVGAGAIVWCDGSVWNIDDASAPTVTTSPVVTKAGDYTIAPSVPTGVDVSGTVFFATTGAVVFTLPAPIVGLTGTMYRFINTVDAAMSIRCDNKIAANTAAVAASGTWDAVTFSTTDHKLGASAVAVCDGTKWWVTNASDAVMTGVND